MRKKTIHNKSFDEALSAIYKNDLAKLRSIINKYNEILKEVDDQKRNLVFYAVLENNLKALNLLID